MNNTQVFIWMSNFVNKVLEELYKHTAEALLFAILLVALQVSTENDGLEQDLWRYIWYSVVSCKERIKMRGITGFGTVK